MNKLYQQLSGISAKNGSILGNIKQAKQMWDTLRNVNNPQAMLQNALQQNPELKGIIDNCNGDYKKAFYTYADKLGVNADEVLQIMK